MSRLYIGSIRRLRANRSRPLLVAAVLALVASLSVACLSIGAAKITPLSPYDTVEGYTYNDDGQILKNVFVRVTHLSSGKVWTDYSDAQGYYAVHVGDYTGRFSVTGILYPYINHYFYFDRPDEYEPVWENVICYKDSDGDDVSDTAPPGKWSEESQGTNPYDPDTDHDGTNDYFDNAPLSRYFYKSRKAYHEGNDCYIIEIEGVIKYNSNSRIVGFENLKTRNTPVDYLCADLYLWDEYVSCPATGYSRTMYDEELILFSSRTHNHGSGSCSERTDISFVCSNSVDGYVYLGPEEGWQNTLRVDMDFTHTENWIG